MSEWERVTSRGKLVWWRRYLTAPKYRDGAHRIVYLAVSRTEDGRWRWALRGPEYGGVRGYQVQAQGVAGTTAAAKRAADAHAQSEGWA